jgi:type IV pilus assembly protein PilX
MRRQQLRRVVARNQQKGIVLIVAIIAIVAMSFAVYAMLRTTNSSLGIAGNIAFKKNATSAADVGIEVATAWVVSKNSTQLNADIGAGYYSTWNAGFDPLTYGWTPGTDAIQVTADDGSGNDIRYVVHRLCSHTGPTSGPGSNAAQKCVRPSDLNNQGGTGKTRSGDEPRADGGGGGRVSGGVITILPASYFRITTRVAGPRNTLSYTQVIIY